MRPGKVARLVIASAAAGTLASTVVVHGWTATPSAPSPTVPLLQGCSVFPADDIWNTRVDSLPVDASSAVYIGTMGASTGLHPDFGAGTWDGGPIGIPWVAVPGSQPLVVIGFDYSDESDPGPYPIPPDAPVEGGIGSSGDRHVLVLDQDNCVLYETWNTWPQSDGSWWAGSGAVFDLSSYALRPAGWTSADAAGLPILPGLVRYDEVASGSITHAIRFTASQTRRAYVWPARHHASSSTDPARPPMGQRFRLRASLDVSSFPRDVQVILVAMQRYGIILADNGSNWYISGEPDERWDNDVMATLGAVKGSDFEAVDCSSLMIDPDSSRARQPLPPPGTSGGRGDADGSGAIDVGDVFYLVNFLFAGGPAPVTLVAGDVDGSGTLDVGDVFYLTSFLFA